MRFRLTPSIANAIFALAGLLIALMAIVATINSTMSVRVGDLIGGQHALDRRNRRVACQHQPDARREPIGEALQLRRQLWSERTERLHSLSCVADSTCGGKRVG